MKEPEAIRTLLFVQKRRGNCIWGTLDAVQLRIFFISPISYV